jgi:hypothetical protein
MNIIEHLQRLDTLIVEHTKPPVTAILRRELSFAIEQGEAYQAASDKQDETLAKQAEAIAALQKQNQALVSKYEKSDGDRHKIGVTLNNGSTVFYDADSYVLLPNKNAPQVVEFHKKSEKFANAVRTVAHVRFSEIKEVHEPAA